MDFSRFTRSAGAATIAAAVLLAGLAVTAVAVYLTEEQVVDVEAEAYFNAHVDRLQAEVTSRVTHAEHGLKGAKGGYRMSGSVDRASFQAYVQARDLEREFPGLRGFGFVERVPRARLGEFVSKARRELGHEFGVSTSGEQDDLLVIKYMEPVAPNRGSLGYDIGAEAVRREAAHRAADEADTTLSGMVTLLQDGRQGPGWIMLVPVFDRPAASVPPQRRREHLVGYFYAPLMASEVLGDLKAFVQQQVDFQLYDGAPAAGRLLYDSEVQADPNGLLPRLGYRHREHITDRGFVIAGRALTLRVAGTPELEQGTRRALGIGIGVGGLLLSVLLASLTWLLLHGRVRALAMAREMTADLQRLARVVEHTSHAVAGLDPQLRIQWINGGFTQITGFGIEEALGRTVDELLHHPQADPDARARQHEAAGLEQGCRVELMNRHKNGGALWLDAELQPVRDGLGRLTGFIEIAQDITLRKQAEQRQEANEHLMRVVTDNVPARVSYWNRERRCQFANRVTCEWMGRERSQLIGRELSAELVGEATYEIVAPRIDAVLRGEQQQFELQEGSAPGQVTTRLVHYIPDQREGDVQGFFVLALDVSELRQARDAALEASQSKTRFLSSMSHELRTPMNAVLGMLTLLRGTELNTRQRDYVDKSDSAARSLLSLLNDILDLAKIEAGKMTLDARAFAVEELMQDLAFILSANVGRKELDVLFDIDPAVPAILVGDDMRLRQILINLGGNAIKFTQQGEVVVELRLLGQGGGFATLELAVRDTGIGIAPGDQKRLFADFSQAKASTSREFGGTGLGLSICRRLAALMGSELRLESEPGRGSRFSMRLELPIAQDLLPQLPAADGVSRVRRVLIVDDNEAARALLSTAAQGQGWQVDTAGNGQEALALLESVRPQEPPYDAIFLDWRMPGMDGWEMSRRIRAAPQTHGAPLLVMITAYGREMLSQRSNDEQALLDGFLVKPVTGAMLAQAVVKARGRTQAPQADPQGADKPLAGLRILLVEDNHNNQQVACELLEREGATVSVAVHGREAVDMVAAAPGGFHVALMDVQMPVMDGLEATREIRRGPAGGALPIVAMTANAMDSDRQACRQAGMDGYVAKPFLIDDLVAELLQHTRHRAEVPATGPRGRPASDPGIWDRGKALAYLGGEEKLFARMMPMFREHLRQLERDLPALPRSMPHQDALRLFHTLKSRAATMGADHLSAVTGKVEASAAGVPTIDSKLLEPLRQALQITLEAIEDAV
ncbi:CHASE domain-containing protein [Ramlibacter tataouinensis]|nr:CHASE domain-containing protein [Ramlibacter tataouinensis]